jgi:integrase/recombinase XerD
MLIPEYSHWLERHQLRATTVKSYPAKAEIFIRWLEGKDQDVAELSDEIVFKFLEHLTIERKQSPNTRRTYMFAIRSYCDFLIGKGILNRNPAKDIALPKRVDVPPGNLSEEEIAKLMTAAFENKTENGMRDLAIISILAGTACRVSAIGEMRIQDFQTVDSIMPERCQHCDQYLLSGRFAGRGKKIKTTIVQLKEKGGKTWPIPIPEKASAYLSLYLGNRKKFFGTDIVFPVRRKGIKPMSRHAVRDMLKRYAIRAGIESLQIHPHMFRHTAITWWLDSGVDLGSVQRYVGHAAVEQTLRYRYKSMRSFVHSGISTDRNLLEHIRTPMDVLFNKAR